MVKTIPSITASNIFHFSLLSLNEKDMFSVIRCSKDVGFTLHNNNIISSIFLKYLWCNSLISTVCWQQLTLERQTQQSILWSKLSLTHGVTHRDDYKNNWACLYSKKNVRALIRDKCLRPKQVRKINKLGGVPVWKFLDIYFSNTMGLRDPLNEIFLKNAIPI